MTLPQGMRLGSVAGIPIEVHPSFILLWFLMLGLQEGPVDGWGALYAAFLTLLIFGSVLLHELGHALVARRFGVRTSRITFYPVGGAAQLTSLHIPPRAELWIAAAGPLVSLVLAASFLGISYLLPESQADLALDAVALNLVVALFNLLPAFPMDGGRILRAALSMRMNSETATRLAMHLGRGFALLLIGLGPWVNWSWLLLGSFLLLLLGIEKGNLKLRAAVDRGQVADAMSLPGPALDITARLDALPTLPGQQPYLIALEPSSGHFLGLIRRSSLEAAQTAGQNQPVAALVIRSQLSTHPTANLGGVIQAMERAGQDAVPVLFGTTVVGILSWGDLHRFVLAEMKRLRQKARNSI